MASLATVSVLFCDLVGSTELLSRVGDQAADSIRRACFAAWRAAIARNSGVEVKSQGDGMMVSFTSAVDAVECGVALQQATAGLTEDTWGTQLALRVGISTGEAACEDDDWFGTPVVEAARLCAAAAPGEILASQLVAALVRTRSERRSHPAGPFPLKGLPEPVEAVAFEWERTPVVEVPPLPRPLRRPPDTVFSFFVGREGELERFERAWKRVRAGEQRCFFIAGEPGIGKTSLAAEAASRLHDVGAVVLYGRCDQELAAPFQPFAEALHRHLVALAPPRLAELSRPHLAEFARLVPAVVDLVPGLPSPAAADPEGERRALFESVSRLLAEAAGDGGLVLVLDDLHWAAKPTLLLLRHLLLSPQPVPMLILGTYRDTDLSRTHPLAEMLADLRRVDAARRIGLRGFDRDEGTEFLSAAAGHDLDERERALGEAVHAVTDGHPLFLREVLSHLAEVGVIYQQDGRWVTEVTDIDFDALGLPEGVRDAISRRLSSLSGAANDVLRAAAVVGPSFETRVLQRLPELSPVADVLLDALDEAEAVGLITAGDTPGSFAFVHALVRQTLYDEVSTARRVRLHRHVAEAMEALPDADARTDALAHHYGEAVHDGVAGKAADYASAAAWRALDRVAPEEALALADRGLEALDLAGFDDPARRSALHLVHAASSEDLPGAKASVERAAEYARAAGDGVLLADAAILFDDFSLLGVEDPLGERLLADALAAAPDEVTRCRLLAHLARYRFRTRAGEGRDLAEEALELARSVDDDAALVDALEAVITVLLGSPDIERRVRLADEFAAATARLDARPAGSGRPRRRTGSHVLNFRANVALQSGDRARHDSEVDAYIGSPRSWLFRGQLSRSLVALMEGRFNEAEQSILAGLADHNQRVGELNNYLGQFLILRRDQGRWAEVIEQLEAWVAGNPRLVVFEAALAMAKAELGSVDDAAAVLRSLVADDLTRIPRDSMFPASLVCLAVTAAIIDDAVAAETLLPHISLYAGQVIILGGYLAVLGAADTYEGMLLATLGRYDEAEASFEHGRALEEGTGAVPYVLRNRIARARMLLRTGSADNAPQAAALLDEVEPAAVRLGMTLLAMEASELRASAGTSVKP